MGKTKKRNERKGKDDERKKRKRGEALSVLPRTAKEVGAREGYEIVAGCRVRVLRGCVCVRMCEVEYVCVERERERERKLKLSY